MDRCTGHCCRNFTLPLSPEELSKLHADWRLEHGDEPAPNDIHVIAPMVVYLGRQSPPEGMLDGFDPVDRESQHRYTCKNLTPEGDCGIYGSRPRMCRDYPYGKRCRYTGCTNEGAQQLAACLKTVDEVQLPEMLSDGSAL